MFKSNNMLPRNRSIIAIGHKYKTQKVLSFIVTEDTERKMKVLPIYISTLTHFLMFPFALLLVPL